MFLAILLECNAALTLAVFSVRAIALTDDEVMARLQLAVFRRLFEIRVIHPVLCDELELIDNGCLVSGEDQSATTGILLFRVWRGEERLSEGNAAPEQPVSLRARLIESAMFVALHNIIARIGLADMTGERTARSGRVARRLWNTVVVVYAEGAFKGAGRIIRVRLLGDRLGGILKLKMVVGAIITAQPRLVVIRFAQDGRAALPTPDQLSAQQVWADAQRLRRDFEKSVKAFYVLTQAAHDKESPVFAPDRARLGWLSRFSIEFVFTFFGFSDLLRVAEDEFARPEQVLTRFALIKVVRVLAWSKDIRRVFREATAQARLAHAVQEPEMLMPGERRRQRLALLFIDDADAAIGVLAVGGSARIDALLNPCHFGGQFCGAIARHDDNYVGLISRPAESPILRITFGGFRRGVSQHAHSPFPHSLLEGFIGKAVGLEAGNAE